MVVERSDVPRHAGILSLVGRPREHWIPWGVRLLFALALAACTGCAANDAPRLPQREIPSAAKGGEHPLRVAVVSDLNGSYGSCDYAREVDAAVDRIVRARPDVVLSAGDMVAGQRRGLDYGAMWDGFHAAVSDRLARAEIPFAVCPGNHDASGYPAFAGERAIYEREWLARRPSIELADGSHYPFRYSFVLGPALFVALDATLVGPLDAEQMAWLDRELARHADVPVKIVFGHVPLYPFAIGREDHHIGDPALEALLVRRGVSLFLSGHHHAYYPGRRGSLRLVSSSCLGSGPRTLLGSSVQSERSVIFFEVTERGVRALDAYAGERFDRPVDRRTLPESVGSFEMRIERDDLRETITLP
jgi:3',5'-cyclic AMP phosphodiesterase CpdA